MIVAVSGIRAEVKSLQESSTFGVHIAISQFHEAFDLTRD